MKKQNGNLKQSMRILNCKLFLFSEEIERILKNLIEIGINLKFVPYEEIENYPVVIGLVEENPILRDFMEIGYLKTTNGLWDIIDVTEKGISIYIVSPAGDAIVFIPFSNIRFVSSVTNDFIRRTGIAVEELINRDKAKENEEKLTSDVIFLKRKNTHNKK